MLGDHILYSHDFSDGEGIDIRKRSLTLITDDFEACHRGRIETPNGKTRHKISNKPTLCLKPLSV